MDSTGGRLPTTRADAAAKLAVLIDADNAPPSMTTQLLAEISRYGTAHVKRAYGDWTGTRLGGWKPHLLEQSIQPVQQFSYTTGKNSTDSAMIIDAMDLLYANHFDGFCLVSSDSDFTRLASRLREAGRTVYGFGQMKTPRPFVVACDKFVYVENLTQVPAKTARPANAPPRSPDGTTTTTPASSPSTVSGENNRALHDILRTAVDNASDEDGWAHLGLVGHLINRQHPDFDQRTYGYAKLNDLFKDVGLFDLDRRRPHESKPTVVYVRVR